MSNFEIDSRLVAASTGYKVSCKVQYALVVQFWFRKCEFNNGIDFPGALMDLIYSKYCFGQEMFMKPLLGNDDIILLNIEISEYFDEMLINWIKDKQSQTIVSVSCANQFAYLTHWPLTMFESSIKYEMNETWKFEYEMMENMNDSGFEIMACTQSNDIEQILNQHKAYHIKIFASDNRVAIKNGTDNNNDNEWQNHDLKNENIEDWNRFWIQYSHSFDHKTITASMQFLNNQNQFVDLPNIWKMCHAPISPIIGCQTGFTWSIRVIHHSFC